MAVDVTALVGGAVGGAAIQSVLGPLFGQIHERRELRAHVLASLAEVERVRWADSEDRMPFRTAVGSLRADALVAGVNRELAEAYVQAAAACYGRSLRNWEMSGGEPESGTISMPLSNYIGACAKALTFYLWHPRWARVIVPLTKRRLKKQKETATRESAAQKEPIRWDSVWIPG